MAPKVAADRARRWFGTALTSLVVAGWPQVAGAQPAPEAPGDPQDVTMASAAAVEAAQRVPLPVDAPVPAAEPSERAPLAHGFVSLGYTFNTGRPASGSNQYRVFDVDDTSPKLDVAEVVFQKPATEPRAFGFRADVLAGMAVPKVSASSGLFRDRESGIVSPEGLDIQQLYGTFVAPIGSGLRIDAGKFATHIGAEVIEGYDGFGDNYTHAYMFGYGEPFTHTGVRAGYALNPGMSVSVLVVNGWDNVWDNNRGKSVGVQMVLTPSERLTFYGNYLGGPERAGSADLRHLVSLVAVIQALPSTAVTLAVDLGHEVGAVAPGQAGAWRGAEAIIKTLVSQRFSVAARAEGFADPDGVRTGVPQTLTELTLTPAYAVARHVVLRGDARLDVSTKPVFETRDRLRRHQITLAFNTLLVF